MANEMTVVKGSRLAKQLTILDETGTAITTYTAAATLAIVCWRGDDTASSFSPTAAWVSAAAGTISMTISAAQSSALTVGRYSLQLTVTGDSGATKVDIGFLDVTETTGSATAATTYATLADLRAECSWLEDIESLRGSRALNFIPEIAQASRWVEDQAMSRLRRAYREQFRRHRPIVTVAAISPTDGVDAGPGWGDSAIPDTTTRDAIATMSGYIDTYGLMTNYGPDRGVLARLTACYALYLALDDQVGAAPNSETPLQAMAMKYRNRAVRMLPGVIFRIDTDSDGVPDFVLEA